MIKDNGLPPTRQSVFQIQLLPPPGFTAGDWEMFRFWMAER